MPSLNVFLEVLVLLGFCMCEALRIFFAKKGNLTESATDTGISILLLVPAVLGVVFFMVWQVQPLCSALPRMGKVKCNPAMLS